MTVQHVVNVHAVDGADTVADGLASHYWVDCTGCTWWAIVAGRANADQRASAHTAAHEDAA